MIKFSLKCAEDHRFDSWFKSAEAFDKLREAGMISCSVCGSSSVEKTVMAPRVQKGEQRVAAQNDMLSTPASPAEQAMADLRRRIEANSDYVGMNFAREARDMHEGTSPERPIHGEALAEDARKLIEDGVPVAPLPFIPGRKTN